MANIRDGVESIIWLAERLDGFRAVAATLDQIGSLDDALITRKDQIAALNAEHDAAQARTAAAKSDEDTLAAKRASALRGHAERADAITSAASEQAEAIVATAKAHAAQMIDDAKAAIAVNEAKWQDRLTELSAEVADLLVQKQMAEANLGKAREDHVEITQKIGALRAQAKTILSDN
jgi:cell division septum initiation protein DivIVA